MGLKAVINRGGPQLHDDYEELPIGLKPQNAVIPEKPSAIDGCLSDSCRYLSNV